MTFDSAAEILFAVLAAGLVALAFAVARLSGKVRGCSRRDGKTPPAAAPEARPGVPGGSSAPDEGAVPGEIVAAISAAVCCLEPGAVVTSVRRAPQNGVSAWKMAGLLENTRPFF